MVSRLNKETFFAEIKKDLFKENFKGTVGTQQIQGLDLLIDEWEKRPDVPRPFFANILATTKWETGSLMQPVRETFAKTDKTAIARLDKAFANGQLTWVNKPYWREGYFGRGYVQLTHKENYQKASEKLGLNLIDNPGLALRPENAVRILFDGMLEGWFTGKKLSDYIDTLDESDAEDFKEQRNARKVVNGTDRDQEIAAYALSFDRALAKAEITTTTPIEESKTLPINVGVGTIGGPAILIQPINDFIKALQGNINSLQWHDYALLIVGVAVIVGAAYNVFARWDAAGRPKILPEFKLPWKWGNK